MALSYLGKQRNLDIKAVILCTDNSRISLSTSNIVSYSINDMCSGQGIAIGAVDASSYSLTLIKSAIAGHTAEQLSNARINVQIGILIDSGYTYTNAGVWYVHSIQAPEQSNTVTVSGFDALASKFSADWVDEGTYPATIGNIVASICAGAGVNLASSAFPNAAIEIAEKPDWGEEATLRTVLGICVTCAGGYAKINRSGALEIKSWVDGATYTLSPTDYARFTLGVGERFNFNCIEAKIGDAEEFARYAVNENIADNATNTIQIEGNPILTDSIVQSLVSEFTGLSVVGAYLSWIGDPAVQIGDFLTITDLKGNTYKMLVTSNTLTFTGGMSAETGSDMPSMNTETSASYSTGSSLFDANGNVKVTRVSGLDSKVIAITAGHFERLTAGTINTDRLIAALIDAMQLRAENISSTTIDTDKLTAAVAEIINASIRRIDAGTIKADLLTASIVSAVTARLQEVVADNITADELTASIVKAVSAHLDRVVAGSITTDELYAAIAKVTSLYVGTGKFDLAEIKNLLSNALILKQGIADSMMITNLAVTSANLLNATIDKLVLKGADGKYYRVFVGADGTIQTEKVTVTDGEIEAGETEEGRQIVATTANVGSLNATTIKASQAVINMIFTESLTAGKITANEALIASATIPILYTTAITALGNSLDLSANESIKLTVQGVRDDVDAAADAAETALGLAEVAQGAANSAQTAAEAAQETADAATETAAEIQTQLEVTKNGLSVIQTETIPGLDGRVKTLESGVHIEGAEIGIYTSESPYRNTITNSGWVISENGTPIIECAETKLTAPRVQITDAMIIGGLAWKPGTDKHVRLLKYGR